MGESCSNWKWKIFFSSLRSSTSLELGDWLELWVSWVVDSFYIISARRNSSCSFLVSIISASIACQTSSLFHSLCIVFINLNLRSSASAITEVGWIPICLLATPYCTYLLKGLSRTSPPPHLASKSSSIATTQSTHVWFIVPSSIIVNFWSSLHTPTTMQRICAFEWL